MNVVAQGDGGVDEHAVLFRGPAEAVQEGVRHQRVWAKEEAPLGAAPREHIGSARNHRSWTHRRRPARSVAFKLPLVGAFRGHQNWR